MFRCAKHHLQGELLVFLLKLHIFYNVIVYNDLLHCKIHDIAQILYSMKQICMENNIVKKCAFEQKYE
jgi:hypothetical protein